MQKDGETIAVKLLYEISTLDDAQFQREFNNLMSLEHDNIVRLIGYCHETRQECAEYNGRTVVADRIRRALCFEFVHNGSLHDNLSGRISWCSMLFCSQHALIVIQIYSYALQDTLDLNR